MRKKDRLPITDIVDQTFASPQSIMILGSGRAFVPFVMEHVHRALTEAAKTGDQRSAHAANERPAAGLQSTNATGGRHRQQLVLVCEAPTVGWCKAVAIAQPADDLFELSWRDFPVPPTVIRRRSDLALPLVQSA